MNTAGVYRWRNKLNNHAYIGSSDKISRRHREQLSFSSCPNGLKEAIIKYGIDSFEYEMLEPIENINNLTKKEFRDYIYEREQVWLDMYFAQEFVLSNGKDRRFKQLTYNIKPLISKTTGVKWTEESKKQRSINYSNGKHPRSGYKMTQEEILAMSKRHIELKISVGEKNPNYGKSSTPEKRAKYLKTKQERGSIVKFYRIDKEFIVTGPFYGIDVYAKDNQLQPRGIRYTINQVDRCKYYKGFTYCKEDDIENRIEMIKTHPNFWGYYKHKKEYYEQRKLIENGKI